MRTAYFAKKAKPKTGEEEIVADENSADFRKAEQDALATPPKTPEQV